LRNGGIGNVEPSFLGAAAAGPVGPEGGVDVSRVGKALGVVSLAGAGSSGVSVAILLWRKGVSTGAYGEAPDDGLRTGGRLQELRYGDTVVPLAPGCIGKVPLML